MDSVHSSFTCSLPFYKTQGDETLLSIILRTSAVAFTQTSEASPNRLKTAAIFGLLKQSDLDWWIQA